jgi:glycosyltransferase involved in cell wall biosynthesis
MDSPLPLVVLIPALNESAMIGVLVRRLREEAPHVPVVVSDCLSTDDTAEQARRAGAWVVREGCVTGRGGALRAGAAFAGEQGLCPRAWWVLHADSEPPPGWDRHIREAVSLPGVVGGAFTQRFKLAGVAWWPRRLLRFVTFCNRTRYALTGVFFGDQGMFFTDAALQSIGGIPEMDLFEDVELSLRLRKVGRLTLLRQRLTTSPRRFVRHGVLRQLMCDTRMLLAYRLRGYRPEEAKHYNASASPRTLADAP